MSDSGGKQPLHLVCEHFPPAIPLLIKRGADVNEEIKVDQRDVLYGKKPLDILMRHHKDSPMIRVLKDAGATQAPLPQPVIYRNEDNIAEQDHTIPAKAESNFYNSNIMMLTACVSAVALLCYVSYKAGFSISNIKQFCSASPDHVKDATIVKSL